MATATLDLIPEVGKFFDSELQQPLVGGKAAAGSNKETFETHDPGSGEKLATVPHFTAKDVDAAVAAAQKAFDTSGWATMPPNERGALLHRLADEVERRIPIIGQIEALDAGKLEPHAQGDVANFVATIRYFAEMAQHISRRNVLAVKGHEAWTMRQPWGPCGYIFPWNFPFLLIGWGIAPECRGKGYALEAARASIDWVFATFEIDEIIHCIDEANAPSQAVAGGSARARIGRLC